jgi:hypothetical protein
VFSCRVFDILNKAQPKYKTRNENTQAIFERGSNNAFRSNRQKISVFCPLLSTCTPPKHVRVWSTEILLLNKNRQNFTWPIYMQLCIFYLLTVRRQENKVFSAAFAAEDTSFPAGGSKLLLLFIVAYVFNNFNHTKNEGRGGRPLPPPSFFHTPINPTLIFPYSYS